ncbi:MAG TPA: alpha/beta hydrolase [Nevskia sp.]|nr:alpha/beta hydrolase [Nevskia sp.]
MSADGFQLPRPDGRSVYVHRWLPPDEPRAALLVAHGMAEHGARYARFAAALNAAGWAAYALDWPGHGRSVRSPDELGHFADRDGWRYALDALHDVRQQVAREQAGKPLFLLGHSMGSFLSQHHLVEEGAGLAGVILSGSSGTLGPLRAVGLTLLRLEAALLGVRHRSALAEALTFKAFNAKFKPNQTSADWLSRDVSEARKYAEDPWCGFRCSAGLWAGLLAAGAGFCDPQRLSHIPKDLPLLLVNGGEDQASFGDKGPRLLFGAYRAAGLKDVTMEVYAGARHELLNEIPECRERVTADVLAWMKQKL